MHLLEISPLRIAEAIQAVGVGRPNLVIPPGVVLQSIRSIHFRAANNHTWLWYIIAVSVHAVPSMGKHGYGPSLH